MRHQVLYRAYRPSKFSEVIGQYYIIKTLQNEIKNNKIAHAYLFCGPRGTGKTSVAKIFAKAVNCPNFTDDLCDECESCVSANNGSNPDIIELDAASNNSVENIREITKYISYAPINGKYKVYIIDEVHMLSSAAFNAFLKTLEEPPEHVIFILATTEPNKVIPTVLSRCQRFNFSKFRTYEIKEMMIKVLNSEGVKYQEEALDVIASLAEGGMRDALSLLEQYLAFNSEEVNLADVEKLFSLTKIEDKIELLNNVHNGNVSNAIARLRELYQGGIDINRLTIELLEIVKETLIFADEAKDEMLERINRVQAQQILQNTSTSSLINDIDCLEDVLSKTRPNQGMLSYLELALIKMADGKQRKQIVVEQKQTTTERPEEVKQKVVEEVNIESSSVNLKDLLNILKTATREEKINDEIIINKIELYKYDSEKRRFYALLQDAKLFASSADAIIISGSKAQMDSINQKDINEDLFNFINDEYGTNKMIYGIDEETQRKLIEMYKQLTPEQRSQTYKIEKYEIKKEESKEDQLKSIFGEIKIEE